MDYYWFVSFISAAAIVLSIVGGVGRGPTPYFLSNMKFTYDMMCIMQESNPILNNRNNYHTSTMLLVGHSHISVWLPFTKWLYYHFNVFYLQVFCIGSINNMLLFQLVGYNHYLPMQIVCVVFHIFLMHDTWHDVLPAWKNHYYKTKLLLYYYYVTLKKKRTRMNTLPTQSTHTSFSYGISYH